MTLFLDISIPNSATMPCLVLLWLLVLFSLLAAVSTVLSSPPSCCLDVDALLALVRFGNRSGKVGSNSVCFISNCFMTLWLDRGLSTWFSTRLLLLVSLLLLACSSVTCTSALRSGLFLPLRCVASPSFRAYPACNTPWSNWSCLTPVCIYKLRSCSECWSYFGFTVELFFSVLSVWMLDLSIVDCFFELSLVRVLIDVLKWLIGVVCMTSPWWPEPYINSYFGLTLFLVACWLSPLLFYCRGPALPIGTELRFWATFSLLMSYGVNNPLSWSRLRTFFAKA